MRKEVEGRDGREGGDGMREKGRKAQRWEGKGRWRTERVKDLSRLTPASSRRLRI